MRAPRREEAYVFLILLASYACFWQTRDWNTGSRLMLTYALVDRGTITLDGLDRQTGDIAYYQGHYYTDKLPGFSLLAAVPYALAKGMLRLPSHPLNQKGMPLWLDDYWATLATSGVLTALTGALLAGVARDLGCGRRRAALVGLAYGLSTPAYVYATLAYGHQPSACALLVSFVLLWRAPEGRDGFRMGLAGLLAAYASVIELQVGPVSAILGAYLLAQVAGKRRRPATVGQFAVGAVGPTILLLGYNVLAFGSPWDMGYFHEVAPIFRNVHSATNPLGLRRLNPARARDLLWGGYRGLLFYAPIVVLTLPGWVVLAARRLWGMLVVSGSVVLAIFLVNLSYPEWTGGWSTGPRLLVPLLPFALLPVAALLAKGGKPVLAAATALAGAGAVLMWLFLGVGGRVPNELRDPLRQFVWPLWQGAPLPSWRNGRFAMNLVALALPESIGALRPSRLWIQLVPLIVAQALACGLALRDLRERPSDDGRVP